MPAEVVVFRFRVVAYKSERMVKGCVKRVVYSHSGLRPCLKNGHSLTSRGGLLLFSAIGIKCQEIRLSPLFLEEIVPSSKR